MCQIHHSQSNVEVCEAVIKDRLYLFTISSRDDKTFRVIIPSFPKNITRSVRVPTQMFICPRPSFSAKRQYPTLNFACPLGLRTPLPRQSQRLWLTCDHRQNFCLLSFKEPTEFGNSSCLLYPFLGQLSPEL